MRYRIKWVLFLLPIWVVLSSFEPKDLKPTPGKIIHDFANVIPDAQERELHRKLVAYNDSTSTQISIVTIETLDGGEIAMFNTELAEQWGVGQGGKDNGIQILLAIEEKRVNIATGYGVEHVVTDALSRRIIENYMVPNFKSGNYYQGLHEATDVIFKLLVGEYKADDVRSEKELPGWATILIIIMIIALVMLSAKGGGRGGGGMRGRDLGTAIWLGSMGRGHSSSGFGGFGSGGGGFGGFGGGSFGGGGASGGW